ncbi:MAG: NAD-dependent deacylase [Candidatus Heimdallarchaeota archaeon]|nr:NAD-dependent deacylase [Candidatus Heimdallarchaeota archaeon]MBY8995506.1 NAD-dependent deacylase [Candidatus Heimdallarchaeota archaeon]
MTEETPFIAAISAVKQIANDKKEQLKIVALTGSGISKGSGIPTFRGKDGLWKNYNAMELATPQAFGRDPHLVWEWYAWRIGIILTKDPNPAHDALVKLQEKGLLEWVITQNVDSLHYRAGSKNLLEVHGNIFRTKCMSCGKKTMLTEAPTEPPNCECGEMLRPDVVWFGESLDRNVLMKVDEIIRNECDVLLVIGTSGVVYPIASLPDLAKKNDILVIEFNVDETPISQVVDFVILGKSEEILPKFVDGITH